MPTGSYAVVVRASGFQDRKQGGIRVVIGTPRDAGNIMLIGTGVAPGPTPGGTPGLPGGKPKEEPGGVVPSPWYKSTWFWVGTAAVAAGGVGYLIWRDRQRKGR